MSLRKVYRKIAREHGVTPAEVKRDMQAAIDHAYQKTPNNGITGAYQGRVPCKGDTPTAEEFIKYAAKQLEPKN